MNYANIGPGRYRFGVRALTSDGVLSSNVAGFEFRVPAPVWQRAWFLFTAFIMCGVASYAFYRYRLARVVRVADMRARIARDLHDDIGANLTRIAVLAEVVRRTGRRPGSGGRSAELDRQCRPAIDDLDGRDRLGRQPGPRSGRRSLTQRMREYAEEVFASDEVVLTLTVPEPLKDLRLRADVRRDLYLVFKEATNNAARHSGCSRFSVEIRRNARRAGDDDCR